MNYPAYNVIIGTEAKVDRAEGSNAYTTCPSANLCPGFLPDGTYDPKKEMQDLGLGNVAMVDGFNDRRQPMKRWLPGAYPASITYSSVLQALSLPARWWERMKQESRSAYSCIVGAVIFWG